MSPLPLAGEGEGEERSRRDDGNGQERDTHERLQSLIEEYETALDELKSPNEELVSVNEELQSTNEEVKASKAELQSVDEEHGQRRLNIKVGALDQANSDLQNLFDSTDVGTLFLDKDLVIRSFTPPVAQIFNILPSDHARPLTDLTSRLSLPELAGGVEEVLVGGGAVERRAADENDRTHDLVRLNPYRDADQQIQGVVASFVGVSELIESEARKGILLAKLQHRTRNLLAIASKRGHGRKLIEKALAYSLRARIELLFEADGICYRIEMPLAQPATVASGQD